MCPACVIVLPPAANRNAGKSRLVSATLCAGLYPQLARILRPTKRFVEVSGGAFERDSLAKELKFYIPRRLASPAASVGASGAVPGVTGAPSAAPAKVADKRNVDISTDDLYRVFLHPSSCNFDNFSFKESNFVMYGERQLVTYPGSAGGGDSKVYLRDTTEAAAFALLFFGGQLQADYSEGTVTVDGWIR
jgi:ATP-dependent RNA helicase DHX57